MFSEKYCRWQSAKAMWKPCVNLHGISLNTVGWGFYCTAVIFLGLSRCNWAHLEGCDCSSFDESALEWDSTYCTVNDSFRSVDICQGWLMLHALICTWCKYTERLQNPSLGFWELCITLLCHSQSSVLRYLLYGISVCVSTLTKRINLSYKMKQFQVA